MRSFGLFILFFVSLLNLNAQDTLDSLLFSYENQTGTEKIKTVIALSTYYSKDDLFKSLDYAKEGLALANEFGDKTDIQNAHNRMGIVYYKLGDLAKSNEHFLEAVKISMERKSPDLYVESRLLNNIANNYGDLKQEYLAIKYYRQSLDLKRKLGDSSLLSITLNNMAITYGQMRRYDSAYVYLKEAMTIDKALSDSVSMAYTIGSMGEIFLKDNQLDSALFYLEQSLAYFEKMKDSDYVLAYYHQKIGEARLGKGLYDASKGDFLAALKLSTKIGAKVIERDCYKSLEEAFEKQGDFKEALLYGHKYAILQDSLFREESAQKLSSIETSYQIKNREQEISVLSAQAEVDELKFYSATGVALVVLLLLSLVFYRYQFKAKANLILRQKNNTIQKQNKEIMDSVEYARGIQEAILPGYHTLTSLFEKAYLFYRPSKIVSGDFYWVDNVGNKTILVLADGTGHGVPGAFLSVLGTGLLRQIISEERICQPDKVLMRLNEKVKEGLGQSKLNNTLKDGMDVAVCVWDKVIGEIKFSGAKRPMLIKQQGKVELVKGDRFSIGGDQAKEPEFVTETFKVSKGDAVVLYTDGVIDQFGGNEGKKFLAKRVVELLEEKQNIDDFGHGFDEIMVNWIGTREQLDDMLLLAVEV